MATSPQPATAQHASADEVFAQMSKLPLFMNSLDLPAAGEEENLELVALKALAYEGTKAEIATNFKEQGNEMTSVKRWADAREYYDKAIAALKMSDDELHTARGAPVEDADKDNPADLVLDLRDGERVVDLDVEAAQEKKLLEASLVNRALCNLELKNYRACNIDCAAVLKLNPRNVKAHYRAASACLSLDKLPEALDACDSGLLLDSSNAALKILHTKIQARTAALKKIETERQERQSLKHRTDATLIHALLDRGVLPDHLPPIGSVPSFGSAATSARRENAPNLEDCAITLSKPLDSASDLCIPMLILYPLDAQTDFIKSVAETESLGALFEWVLPPPWDSAHAYNSHESVECHVETVAGTLLKIGKNVPVRKMLATGKVGLEAGLIKVNVVPRDRADEWTAMHKQRVQKKT